MQRLAKADAVSDCYRQPSRFTIAIDGHHVEVLAPNQAFLTQNFARRKIERDGIAVPAGNDDDIISKTLPKISPSLDRTGLSRVETRNQIHTIVLSVGAQTHL